MRGFGARRTSPGARVGRRVERQWRTARSGWVGCPVYGSERQLELPAEPAAVGSGRAPVSAPVGAWVARWVARWVVWWCGGRPGAAGTDRRGRGRACSPASHHPTAAPAGGPADSDGFGAGRASAAAWVCPSVGCAAHRPAAAMYWPSRWCAGRRAGWTRGWATAPPLPVAPRPPPDGSGARPLPSAASAEQPEGLVGEEALDQRPDQRPAAPAADRGQHPERDLEQDVQQRDRDEQVHQPGPVGAEDGEPAGGEEHPDRGDQREALSDLDGRDSRRTLSTTRRRCPRSAAGRGTSARAVRRRSG